MRVAAGNMARWSLLVMALMAAAQAKVFEHHVSINKLKANRAHYITKFKFYNGGHFTLELKADQATEKELADLGLQMGMLTRAEYLQMESLERCELQSAVAKLNLSLPVTANQSLKLDHSFTEKQAKADYIYFVLFACKLNPRPTKSKLKFHFLFDFRNSGHHYSAGEEFLTSIYGVAALVFMGIFVVMLRDFYREMIKKSGSETNYPYIIVNTSLLLKLVSLALDLVDLFMFSADGIGFIFLNFLSQAANHISQYLLIVLLVFLAKGWTLVFEDISEFELFLPISIIVGIFQVIVIGLGKMDDNSPLFFHRYDSFVGWILPLFNVALCVYFVVEGLETLKLVKGNAKTTKFLKWLLALGSFYFAFFPVVLLLSLGAEPERRMVLIEVGRIISQLVGLTFMAYVTGSKRGVYKEIALFEMIGVLPTARESETQKLKSARAME